MQVVVQIQLRMDDSIEKSQGMLDLKYWTDGEGRAFRETEKESAGMSNEGDALIWLA